MNPIAVLKRHFANVERSRQLLTEIREGVANLAELGDRHLTKLAEVQADKAEKSAAVRRLDTNGP